MWARVFYFDFKMKTKVSVFIDVLIIHSLFLENSGPRNRDRSPIRQARGRGRERGRARGRGQIARRGSAGRHQGPVEPNTDWHDEYTKVQMPDFLEPNPGPTRRFPNINATRQRDFFDILFTDSIWKLLVRETNKYYDQSKAAEPNKHKRAWSPGTREEMEAFIEILVLMGIVKLPRFEMYWNEDKLVHQESIVNIMPQTRFLQIWHYFHLAHNSTAIPRGADGFDKIYRVQEYLSIILRNIQHEYRLDQTLP